MVVGGSYIIFLPSTPSSPFRLNSVLSYPFEKPPIFLIYTLACSTEVPVAELIHARFLYLYTHVHTLHAVEINALFGYMRLDLWKRSWYVAHSH